MKINFGNKTWTNPYARFTQPDSGLIWSVAAGAASTTTVWGDSDIALVWSALLGKWYLVIPVGISGEWDLDIYDNATPANTDDIVFERRLNLSPNGGMGEVPQTTREG